MQRKVDEAVTNDALIAKYLAGAIAKLYKIEKQIREKSDLTEFEIGLEMDLNRTLHVVESQVKIYRWSKSHFRSY